MIVLKERCIKIADLEGKKKNRHVIFKKYISVLKAIRRKVFLGIVK